jgi:plasmid stabilization system protein ParE
MAQVAWTAEAQLWLRDIYDYIAADNPIAAERVALAIYDSVRVLRRQRLRAIEPRQRPTVQPGSDVAPAARKSPAPGRARSSRQNRV